MIKQTAFSNLVWTSLQRFFMQLTFLKASRILLGLFILFFPFQIRTLVYSGSLYVSGNFNPYTTYFFYLTDLFLVLSFLCWGIAIWRKEHQLRFNYGDQVLTFLIMLFLISLGISTVFAQDKVLHLLLTFRFIEFFLLYLLIVNEVLNFRQIIYLFLITMAFQSLTSIFQYLAQGSIGLKILGEPIASPLTPGVAKIDIPDGKILRAFGTFPHANILGGALLTALLFCFFHLRKNLWILIPLLILFGAALILCFSRSAVFGLFACFMVAVSLNSKKIPFKLILLVLSMALFFIVLFRLENIFFQRFLFEDLASVQERTAYFNISKNMFLNNPFGIGLGGFTLFMQNFTGEKLLPWLFQPVHNTLFLLTNETGIQGGLIFISILIYLFYRLLYNKLQSKKSEKTISNLFVIGLCGIGTIALFDHYFFSIYQGQIILFIYLALISNFLNKALLPSKNDEIASGALPSN